MLVVLLFIGAPRHGAVVLSSVSEPKEFVMCLMEKMHVLDELRSGISYSAIGCGSSVNEWTVYIK